MKKRQLTARQSLALSVVFCLVFAYYLTIDHGFIGRVRHINIALLVFSTAMFVYYLFRVISGSRK